MFVSCVCHAQLYPKKAFYLWTGANNFVQLSGEDFLSVGGYRHYLYCCCLTRTDHQRRVVELRRGSGTMGLWLNDDFSGGSSQTCDTFANAPLASTCVCLLHNTHTHTTHIQHHLAPHAVCAQGGVQRTLRGGVGLRGVGMTSLSASLVVNK
jgi:hypothetical protein